MRIYYDYQIFFMQRYGGISRYFYELMTRINTYGGGGVQCEACCLFSYNYYLGSNVNFKHSRIVNKILRKFSHSLNRINSLIHLRRDYDIIHPTYYNPYLLGHYSGKLVVTVYDMIHEIYNSVDGTIENKRKMLHAADLLLAISESTKRDILKIYPEINSEKIHVVHLGNSMKLTEIKSAPIKERYILFVGNRSWYKNFERFVQAVNPILDKHSDIHILCVGGGTFTTKELNIFGRNITRFHQLSLDDETLAQAYAHALCFVFPSEYEGFGIPVLEAFACKCPLVCSSSSSLPEVGGDAALYFDPFDVGEMSAKIAQVLEDENLRKNLIAAGTERLKLFSWDKTARETFECYKQIL